MSKKTKVIPVIILVLSLIISQTACSKKTNQSTDPVQKSGFYLDTVCNLTIYDMKDMSEETMQVGQKSSAQTRHYLSSKKQSNMPSFQRGNLMLR